MQDDDETTAALGNEPPLIADGRSRPPDRREVSIRWLSGTFLTGIFSSLLMGIALSVALDGREQLATPTEVAQLLKPNKVGEAGEQAKTDRVAPTRQIIRTRDRRRMELSTVSRVGDRNVIRTIPFLQIKMMLAANHSTNRSYPPFDPLSVFAEDGATRQAPTTGTIYGAKVESEMSLKTIDFPLDTAAFDEQSVLSADEVELVVRNTGAILTDGDVQVAALHYIDPERFGESLATQVLSAYDIKIVQENVSVAPRGTSDQAGLAFAEEIIPFTTPRKIVDALAESGYAGPDATGMADAIAKLLNAETLREGTVLRVGLEVHGDIASVVRTSIYNHSQHVLTIALNDKKQFVPTGEPEPNPEILTAFDSSPPVRVRGELPTVYDGLYRAAYSYGLSKEMTRQLIKLLASDVDYQSRINSTDQIDVFFSQPDANNEVSEESELLYASATFGGHTRTFYRFQMEDGTIDYFDQEGRSAQQFLLRNPVPNGKFQSGFGSRRHPILGYARMHTGVDWSAPRGTPIIAAGNGTVEKAGWAGTYGNQTIIRHANGYQTSYNHQSAIAKDVVAGARIRQGQVIGYIGTTGLSTGNHLHYELIVNGRKVDPMRVRLPVGRVLKGEELVAFKSERERIDELLKDENNGSPLKVASSTASKTP